MGKVLIIKGADFSAVAVDKVISFDFEVYKSSAFIKYPISAGNTPDSWEGSASGFQINSAIVPENTKLQLKYWIKSEGDISKAALIDENNNIVSNLGGNLSSNLPTGGFVEIIFDTTDYPTAKKIVFTDTPTVEGYKEPIMTIKEN